MSQIHNSGSRQPDMREIRERSAVEKLRTDDRSDIQNPLTLTAKATANVDLLKMMDDPQRGEMVTTVVERLPDGRFQWIHEGERELVQVLNDQFLRDMEKIEQHKKTETKSIHDFLATLKETKQNLEEAEKDYQGDLVNSKMVLQTIENYEREETALQKHHHALIDAANIVLQSDATGKALKAALTIDVTEDFRTFIDDLPDEVLSDDRKNDAKERLIRESSLAFSDSDRGILINAKNDADTILQNLETAEDALIARKFPERGEYLRRLGGATAESMIDLAVSKEKNKTANIDLQRLNALLAPLVYDDNTISTERLKKEIRSETDIVELTPQIRKKLADYLNSLSIENAPGVPIIDHSIDESIIDIGKIPQEIDIDVLEATLLSYNIHADKNILQQKAGFSKTGVLDEKVRKNILDYLHTLKIDNPIGISIRDLALRATLPEEMAHELEARDMRTLTVGALMEFASNPKLALNDTAKLATELINLCSSTETNKKTGDVVLALDTKKISELLTFVFLKTDAVEASANATDVINALLADPRFVKRGGETVVTSSSNKKELESALASRITVGEKAKIYAEQMQRAGAGDRTWIDLIKKYTKEGKDLIVVGGGLWWDYVKNIPKDFWYKEMDGELLSMLNQKRALRRYKEAIQSMLDADAGTEKAMERIMQTMETDQKTKESVLKDPMNPAVGLHESIEQQKYHLLASSHIFEQLQEKYSISRLDHDTQRTAYWLAVHKGLAEAEKYLASDTYQLDPVDAAAIIAYLARGRLLQEQAGEDILAKMRHDTGLSVVPMSLDLLVSTAHPTESAPLAASTAAVDNWFLHPELASPALRVVFAGPDDVKTALIDRFCFKKETPYIGPDGKPRTITPAQADQYVLAAVEHLKYQSRDFESSTRVAGHDERYRTPLDIMRTGAGAIKDMLTSGDRVKQALALSMIMATVYVLYRSWTKGGLGKKLILGVPLFFGADAVMKTMMGKGILDYLHLNYMKEEDRNSAVEQFVRESEQKSEYGFMHEAAGHEAVRQLMEAKKNIPVADLLEWRRVVARTPHGTRYSADPPPELASCASNVIAEMGLMETQGMDSKAKKERAYEYLYRAFDALCVDVAERNGLAQPTAERGADLIYKRYVTFEDLTTLPFKDVLSQTHRNGFTVLDVLVYERPTPAMQNALLENNTLLEMICARTGMTFDFVLVRLKQGMALSKIYALYLAEKVPEAASATKEFATDSANNIYNWLRTTLVKGKADVEANYAALKNLTIAMTDSGISLIKQTPDAAEWLFDSALDATSFTIDKAQNLYRIIQTLPVTGPALDALDRLSLSTFGVSISRIALYDAAVEKNNPHVEELAEAESWKKEFKTQIQNAANAPSDAVIDRWINDAAKEISTSKQLSAHERMAVYELVKRAVYSHLIARRITALKARSGTITYPLAIDWKAVDIARAADPVEQSIRDTYNFGTLNLIGAEKTNTGEFEDYVHTYPKGIVNRGLKGVHWSMDLFTFGNAKEYLDAADEYFDQFMSEADEIYKDLPAQEKEKKLSEYRDYISTLLTNAVIEMTLTKAPKSMLLKDTAVNPEAKRPLMLAIEQAKDYLAYLRLTRGSSLDPQKLKNIDFSKFHSAEDIPSALQSVLADPEWVRRIQSSGIKPLVRPAPATGTAPAAEDLREALAVTGKPTEAQEEVLLEEIENPSLSIEDRVSVQERLAEAYKDGALGKNLNDPDERHRYYKYLEGVTNATADVIEKQIREHMFEKKNEQYVHDPDAMIQEITRERDAVKSPEAKERLQNLLDKAVVLQLKRLLNEIMKVNIDDVASHPDKEKWEKELIRLYRATSPETDRITDLVSYLLEYVLYQVKHNSEPDSQGRTNFDKYTAFLANNHLNAPQLPYYPYGGTSLMRWSNNYPGSQKRMAYSMQGVTAGYLTQDNALKERMNVLAEDIGIKSEIDNITQ